MTVKDFLENDQFIFYMLAKDAQSVKYWKTYLTKYPSDKQRFQSAVETFEKIKFNREHLQSSDRELLHNRIFNNNSKHYIIKKSNRRLIYSAAACVLIFLSISTYRTLNQNQVSEILVEKSATETSIQLISGNKTFVLSNNEVLTVNEEGIVNSEGENLKTSDSIIYNILKVPFGKRSELVLSDGSKLWLNSGSTVKFPNRFSENSRIIYLEGEIYIQVSKNELKPFKVETSKFNVNVYGTTFNVKAYNDATDQRVVLVEGSVGVSTKNNMHAEMVPNESLEITASQLIKKTVDTKIYTSWKNGYLIFDDTPIETILLELSRYYNVTFLDSKKDLIGKRCTGKIYLSTNLKDVLETLSILSNTSFKVNNTI